MNTETNTPDNDAITATLAAHAHLLHAADSSPALSDAEQQQIMDYVDGAGDAQSRAAAAALIQNNPAAQKAALHYASHRAAMSQDVPPQIDAATQPSSSGFSLAQLAHKLLGWLDNRVPLWAALPATALAAYAVVASLPLLDNHAPHNLQVASYQDNPVLQFRAPGQLPGIGFFSQADNTTAPYTNIRITAVQDDATGNSAVQIQWPPIADAVTYSLRLQLFDKGMKKPVGEQRTSANHARFELGKLETGKRYEWVLTGNTRDNKTFYTTGGFVLQPAP